MKLDTLQKLYINELRDLYNAENQLVKALPRLAKRASSPALKEALTSHLKETQEHVARLESISQTMGVKLSGKLPRLG